jgi:CelD/BcsL family acetyltransferase involved in cellulose biosynthesis
LAELKLPLSIAAINSSEAAGWDRLPKEHFSTAPQLLNREITAEDFARRHSRAFSRLRKLQRIGLHLCQYSGSSPIVRQIYARRAQQSDGEDLFRDPLRVEFMVAVCREAGNSCEVFALEHGGTLVAALVTFRDHEFRRFYTAYYDHGWARYSPGVSLLFEIVRRSLEQGLNVDLMTGEQAYKMRIAKGRQELFRVNASAAQLSEAFPDSPRKEVAA